MIVIYRNEGKPKGGYLKSAGSLDEGIPEMHLEASGGLTRKKEWRNMF